jgi:hypothetical protein
VLASLTPASITVTLNIGSVAQNVEVSAIAGDSIAAQHALSQDALDTEVPKSEISSEYIQEFAPPTTDYSEIVNIAPGTISYNFNGVGLGQGTIYFRGFIDGDFDLTWDGIPEGDTNNFAHHSWVYSPVRGLAALNSIGVPALPRPSARQPMAVRSIFSLPTFLRSSPYSRRSRTTLSTRCSLTATTAPGCWVRRKISA